MGLKKYKAYDGVLMDVETGEPVDVDGHDLYLASDVDAALPRTWTAETIKDAPEGLYTYHMDKLKRDPAIQLFTKRGVAELLDWYQKTQCPEYFAFGPIPTPQPEDKE